jgi:HD superfamily phosphodiesterase
MTITGSDDPAPWLACTPEAPEDWFLRRSGLHGVAHTRRVCIHARRLTEELGWPPEDAVLVLRAALYHDIGRLGDGVEPGHGAGSVARADELGLLAALPQADAAVVRFAIRRHSLRDAGAPPDAEKLAAASDPARRLAEPERALRVLWLLKDADALDRIRLGPGEHADPRQLRWARTAGLLVFAEALYRASR